MLVVRLFDLKNEQPQCTRGTGSPWPVMQGRAAAGLLLGATEGSSWCFVLCALSGLPDKCWGRCEQGSLEGIRKRPPEVITLNLSFQVLSLNMVPQSSPAGTLQPRSLWSQIKLLSSASRSWAALWSCACFRCLGVWIWELLPAVQPWQQESRAGPPGEEWTAAHWGYSVQPDRRRKKSHAEPMCLPCEPCVEVVDPLFSREPHPRMYPCDPAAA